MKTKQLKTIYKSADDKWIVWIKTKTWKLYDVSQFQLSKMLAYAILNCDRPLSGQLMREKNAVHRTSYVSFNQILTMEWHIHDDNVYELHPRSITITRRKMRRKNWFADYKLAFGKQVKNRLNLNGFQPFLQRYGWFWRRENKIYVIIIWYLCQAIDMFRSAVFCLPNKSRRFRWWWARATSDLHTNRDIIQMFTEFH